MRKYSAKSKLFEINKQEGKYQNKLISYVSCQGDIRARQQLPGGYTSTSTAARGTYVHVNRCQGDIRPRQQLSVPPACKKVNYLTGKCAASHGLYCVLHGRCSSGSCKKGWSYAVAATARRDRAMASHVQGGDPGSAGICYVTGHVGTRRGRG